MQASFRQHIMLFLTLVSILCEIPLTIDEALIIVDTLLRPARLNNLQESILRGCWLGKTYQDIAEETDYDANYVRVIGARLWRQLSAETGEKVSKSNIRSVLRYREQQLGQATRNKPYPELEFPDGPVPLHSRFYVSRPDIEQSCCQEINRPGSLIRIKAPSQMGKTSMTIRLLDYARTQGYRTARLDFQQVDLRAFEDLDRFLRWFCANLTQKLGLRLNLDEEWDQDLGSKVSCTQYFQNCLVAQSDTPLVLVLDQVNRIFEQPEIAGDFLPMLRFWHEEANNLEVWTRLRLIVVHSTEIYVPLNLNRSPFNVGLPVQLQVFDRDQIQFLADCHGFDWSNEAAGQRFLDPLQVLTNGHPYLIRLALYHLARQEIDIEQLLERAPTQTGIYTNHLQGHLATLQQHPDLAAAFKQAMQAQDFVVLESIPAYKLASLGLVRLNGNQASISCNLYRQYFRDRIQQF